METTAEVFLNDCTSPGERTNLKKQIEVIGQSLKETEDVLGHKTEAHAAYVEFSSVLQKQENEIKSILEKLADKNLMPNEISDLQQSLGESEGCLRDLKVSHGHLLEVLNKADIVFINPSSQSIMDGSSGLENLLETVVDKRVDLDSRKEKLMQLEENKMRFEDIEGALSVFHKSMDCQISDILRSVSSKPSSEDLQRVTEELEAAGRQLEKNEALVQEFSRLGQQLKADDPENCYQLSDAVNSFVTKFQEMRQETRRQADEAQGLAVQLQRYQDLRLQTKENLYDMTMTLSGDTLAASLKEAREKLDKYKVGSG